MICNPGAPLTYFSDSKFQGIFWGLSRSRSMKDAGIFLGCEKTQGFFGELYFSSVQINNNRHSLLLVWDLLGGML